MGGRKSASKNEIKKMSKIKKRADILKDGLADLEFADPAIPERKATLGNIEMIGNPKKDVQSHENNNLEIPPEKNTAATDEKIPMQLNTDYILREIFDWPELQEMERIFERKQKYADGCEENFPMDWDCEDKDKAFGTTKGWDRNGNWGQCGLDLLPLISEEESSRRSNKIEENGKEDGDDDLSVLKEKENSLMSINSDIGNNEKKDDSTQDWPAEESDEKFEVVVNRKAKKKNLQAQQKNSQQQIPKQHSQSLNSIPSTPDTPPLTPRSDSTSSVPQKKEQKDHFSWPQDFDLVGEVNKKKMPPNRKVNHNHGGGARAQQLQPANQYNPQRRNNNGPHNNGVYNKPLTCCVPSECFEPEKLIYVEDIGTRELEVMKVVCNNEHCDQGQFMHLDCFLVWEQALSKHVKSYGRARSWSEKQRLENIWTKKGYDLAFKACSCKCGRGHLRKDLDWMPPQRTVVNNNQNGNAAGGAGAGNAAAVPANQAPDQNPQAGAQVVENPVQANAGKKKKTKNREQRPKLAVSAPVHHPNNNNVNQYYYHGQQQAGGYAKPGTSSGCHVPQSPCASGSRSNSIDYGLGTSVESSGTFSQSPPLSQGSQGTKCRSRMDSLSSNGSGSSGISEAVMANLARRGSRKITERPIFTGDFATRENCSAFNILPQHKRTPFHVKVNDEVDSSEKASGVDATRMFLLSTLLRSKQSHVCCVLCEDYMTVYDRYPLLDGTFFLSPMPYLRDSIPVRDDLLIEKSRVMEGSKLFLNAVCMRCLEGWNKVLHCKFCNVKWDGSDYMLGTCYNYDIFADVCCPHRVLCKTCNNIVVHPGDRELFFSDYGNHFECPHCGIRDYHLVKEIEAVFHVYPPRCQY